MSIFIKNLKTFTSDFTGEQKRISCKQQTLGNNATEIQGNASRVGERL